MIAIDPGRSTGWARFERGRLVAAGHTDGDRPVVPAPDDGVSVIEVPSPGDQRAPVVDLLVLARRAGLVAGVLAAARLAGPFRLDAGEFFVAARTWKGSVPKLVMGKRILALLDAEELGALGPKARHDAIDAVGLGLWKLGRLK